MSLWSCLRRSAQEGKRGISMRSVFGKLAVVAVMFMGGTAFGSDCWNANEIMRAAHNLENQANHFHDQVERQTGYGHLARDAHQLAAEARHFHSSVERRASCRHVSNDFRGLAREFRHIRRAFAQAHRIHHNYHLQRDFDELARSFQYVRRAVRWSGGGYHYLSGRGNERFILATAGI